MSWGLRQWSDSVKNVGLWWTLHGEELPRESGYAWGSSVTSHQTLTLRIIITVIIIVIISPSPSSPFITIPSIYIYPFIHLYGSYRIIIWNLHCFFSSSLHIRVTIYLTYFSHLMHAFLFSCNFLIWFISFYNAFSLFIFICILCLS